MIGLEDTRGPLQLLKRILLQKHLCWAYEEEVRVVKRVSCGFGQTVEEFYQSLENNFEMFHEPIPGRDNSVQAKAGFEGFFLSKMTVPIKEVYLGLRCAEAFDGETIKALEEVPTLY